MGRQITIEICLDSLQSARTVQRVAAEFDGRVKWRIELCSNLIHGGGLTPSIGLLRSIRKLLPDVEVMVMIRPRIGNFTYSQDENLTMEEDIKMLKREGASAFVFGCLTSSRSIDISSMTRLCTAVGDLPVTFHRAIDLMASPLDGPGIKELESNPGTSNVTRVLTSGGQKTAWEGREMLKSLMDDCRHRITILPGSGINAGNLEVLLRDLPQLTEIHLTASEAVTQEEVESESHSTLSEDMARFGFGDNEIWTMNENKLRAVFEVIDRAQSNPT